MPIILSAMGLYSDGSTRLFTYGAPSVRAVPPRQAPDMVRVKSPARTSAVGTVWSAATGAMRVLVAELLQRVGERHRVPGIVLRVVVVAAVDEIHRAVARAAGHGDRHGVGVLAVVRERRVLDSRPGEHDELQDAAAVERQIDDL